MKLHNSVIQRLERIYSLHGGRRDNKKLVEALQALDLSPYIQKENPKHESFLVLTEDLQPKPQ